LNERSDVDLDLPVRRRRVLFSVMRVAVARL